MGKFIASWIVGALVLAMLSGCHTVGFSSDRKPGERVGGAYSGLSGQKVGIMVWADWATKTEYNRIQLDLRGWCRPGWSCAPAPRDRDRPELSNIEWLDPASIVRFQREHPEYDTLPIADMAPKLGVSRVIYIELEHFQAQSPQSILLLQGRATATLRIVEVADRKAKVVYEEMGIKAEYPPNAPEGVPPSDNMNVRTVYLGTLHTLAEAIVARMEEK